MDDEKLAVRYEHNRSVPWTDEEKIRVDGHRLYYTAEKGVEIVVHIPGGRSCTVRELKERGRNVIEPHILRKAVARSDY